MGLANRVLCVASMLVLFVAPVPAQQVYKAGDGVSLPVVVESVNPDCTPEARAAGIEGSVALAAVVLPDGRVGDVDVVRSLDAMLGLDREAVKAMKQWTFKPGTKDGTAVAVRIEVRMNFALR